eukprot:maker-scaffold180_size281610-snap-gene-0.40 protein:Tk11864 transcript:maker-scaffold180_size281610-snap-gene-0.40-mRNA-1 annotation:"39s ribosomal protein mitochondrial"
MRLTWVAWGRKGINHWELLCHKHWNNRWQLGRHQRIKNRDFARRIAERGIPVLTPEDVMHYPTLPPMPTYEGVEWATEPSREPFLDRKDHPLYQDEPVHTLHCHSKFIQGSELDQAKSLTKSVEVQAGLPQAVLAAIPQVELFPRQDERIQTTIRETFMFDALQVPLPRRVAVPHIGWTPVVDQMFRPLPYPEPKYSWQRKLAREFGIPTMRKSFNLTRGLLRYCDALSVDYPELLDRAVLEDNGLNQFFSRLDRRVLFKLSIPILITDPRPLAPFLDSAEVEATRELAVPDLDPLNCFASMWPNHVYRDANTFPVVDSGHAAPNVHLGFGFDPTFEYYFNERVYAARSLTSSFLLALGQARMRFGSDVAGVLPEPVSVKFIYTNGFRMSFTAFQLNTLDLNDDSGVKNVFWHEPRHEFFTKCEYDQGLPTLEAYNPKTFTTLLGLYLQGVNKL